MHKIILTAVLMTAISLPAMAGFQVSAIDSDVGKNCFSESSTTKLYKLTGPDIWDLVESDACDNYSSFSNWNGSGESHCWISHTGSALYVCFKGTNVNDCPWAQPWAPYSWDWYNAGNNRLYRIDDIETKSIANYTCTATPIYIYGCAEGYYKSGGGDDSSMICSKCPTPGTSDEGETDITSCYVPSGSGYNDGTGTFKVSDDCYYNQ